jgi:PAS domain-containing protein
MTTTAAASLEPGAQRDGIGVFEWNPVTGSLQWDETLAAIFVADRAGEVPFETWRRRTHPDDQARVLETFSEFKEAEDLYRLVLDDGTIRFVLSRATNVVRDSAGSPIKVMGVVIDVTTAQMAGARLTAMLESISEGFVAMNDEFRFTYVNASAELLLGLDREAIVGELLWDLFPQSLGTQFEEAYRRVLRDRVSVSFVDPGERAARQ